MNDTSIQFKFLADMLVLPDGRVIVTEASQKHPMHMLDRSLWEGDVSGR